MQDTAHQGGPLEDPLEQASPRSRMCASLGWAPPRSGGGTLTSSRVRLARGPAPPSNGVRLARGSAPPSNGVRLARRHSTRARLLPYAGI
jgi:hypothetical protein